MEITREQVVDYLSNLPVIQVTDLIRELETRWGVSATPAPVADVVRDSSQVPVEEQSEFTLELVEAGPNKIQVIKVVREVLGLGLKEAKDLVDQTPRVIKDGLSKADTDSLKAKLEEHGAKVSVR